MCRIAPRSTAIPLSRHPGRAGAAGRQRAAARRTSAAHPAACRMNGASTWADERVCSSMTPIGRGCNRARPRGGPRPVRGGHRAHRRRTRRGSGRRRPHHREPHARCGRRAYGARTVDRRQPHRRSVHPRRGGAVVSAVDGDLRCGIGVEPDPAGPSGWSSCLRLVTLDGAPDAVHFSFDLPPVGQLGPTSAVRSSSAVSPRRGRSVSASVPTTTVQWTR